VPLIDADTLRALIERHEGFRGFLGQNAKGIFESTKMRR
jgi:hypothetical protein